MLDLNTVLNSIGAQETEYPFRPVKCLEKDLENKPPINGFVYFTTDTKKIYCGTQNSYLLMGGTSGIYYGQRIFTEDETDTEEISFIFTKSEIEGSEIPNINDLILNIPDGGFYRVKNVYNEEITVERIAIAGGSGGGSGPIGPGTGTTRPAITDTERGVRYFTTANPDNIKLTFYCTSQSAENNYIDEIHYTIGVDTYIQKGPYNFGANNIIEIDLKKYLNKFSLNNQNTVSVVAYDAYGNFSQKKLFHFYLIELTLKSDFSSIYRFNSNSELDNFSYQFTPIGGASLESKYVEITLAPINNLDGIIWSQQFTIDKTNDRTSVRIPIKNIEGISHEVYLLKSRYYGLNPNTGEALYSNELSSQIVYYDVEIGTPLIATSFVNTTISQYSKYSMQYMIVDESTSVNNTAIIYVGNEKSEETIQLNEINTWTHTFIATGVYEISIQYGTSGIQRLGNINVVKYKGDIPVIDNSSAELYLTAMGKSNSQVDKNVWTWSNPAISSEVYAANFENFLWGKENGWLTDKNGDSVLKLSNGAKLTIPNYYPFKTEATEDGLTIELDFMFSGVLDYSKPLIQCLSTYISEGETIVQTGFHITGQKATLNSSINKATIQTIGGEEDADGNINETDMALQAFTQYFNEDTRIHLTYVIQRIPNWSSIEDGIFYFVYTYLNGVLSGIMKMKVDAENETKESFKDAAGRPAILTFDSTYGDIYLYNIRVYRNELSMRTVINNYIADIGNVDEKIALYQNNNVFDDSGAISLNAIQNIAYECKVPYVLFKGGNSMEKKFKDAFKFEDSYRLPLTKSDYRFVSMKMYDVREDTGETYLALDVPIEAKNQANVDEIVNDFNDLVSGNSYLPTRGVQLYGQGTSSMVYPTKNLRLKFVQEKDYPVVYKGSYPVEIVCFKADYMDSSSAHNTCTGNLVYDIYQSLNLKSPAQQFQLDNKGKDGVAEYDLVTAIKGYPIICFYAPGDSDEYQFIGRYNFNLDKATPEPFGFIPQKVETGETVVDENGNTRKVVKTCGLKTEIVDGKIVLPIDKEGKEIERDIVQCWEILNNDNGSPTKFLKLEGYNTFEECLKALTSKGDKYNWMEYYEDRYPDAIVSGGKWIIGDKEEDEYKYYEEDLNNGLFRMAKWINSTATEEYTGNQFENPVYYQTMDTSWNRDKTYYTAEGIEYVVETEEGTSIKDTSVNIDSTLKNLSINKDTFVSKVGSGNFDSYAFLYSDGWYLDGKSVNLTDYGISFTGTPVDGSGLTVNYYETNNWSNALYDQYTTDSAEYRLSKFKTEFTQYFDMNFSLFYYIMTLTLLMMDSRAKNMMLASWDQTIWYPIFYDMDTMLGVNNTGFNKFSFDTEDDPADKVFNGFDSVLWNNFRSCFGPQIADYYAKMRSSMTLAKLLKTYNKEGADAWAEAFCSADAFYKYKRPYEEGYYDGKDGKEILPGTVSYLYAAQGKRSNHRTWWLSNRLNYLDSKFIPLTYGNEKPSQTDAFSFRAYALPEQKSTDNALACVEKVPPNHRFNIKALNNSYQSIFIGNIVYGPTYATAGQVVTLGSSEVKHEVESYILNPTLISDLGDLSDKYLGSFNFPSGGGATRLTRLKFGRSQYAPNEEENNNYEYYYNNLLTGLNIGTTCPYLEEINIARCTGLASIELNKCPRLQYIYADGSKLADIGFPADSILKEIYLPATLTSLVLTNQPYLTTIHLDGTSRITSLFLDNVSNVDTYELTKEIFNGESVKQFYLTNINWNINDAQDGQNESGKLESIDILETLLSDKAAARDGYTKAQCLSGIITINIEGCSVDEFTIYNKYNKLFPNLKIKYSDKVSVTKAKHIVFMNDSADDAIVHYEVFGDGTETIGKLISASGPNGVAMRNPSKGSSEAFDYEFTGYWIDQNGVRYYVPDLVEAPDEENELNLLETNPTKDLTFVPEYNAIDRYYEVRFYDYDGSIILQDGQESWPVKYNSVYDGPIKNFYYRDSSNLSEYDRYAFQGWTLTNLGNTITNNPSYVVLEGLIIKRNLNLYAYYLIEDVRKVATKEEYFDFASDSITIKEEYRQTLAGKITLPSKHDGKYLKTIRNFSNVQKITHVFFLEDAQYTTVNGNAFSFTNYPSDAEPYKLVKVELPQSIRIIESGAFNGCKTLLEVVLNDNITSIGGSAFGNTGQVKISINGESRLPKELTTLGIGAFQGAGNNLILTSLPDKLKDIPQGAFSSCGGVKITEFGRHKDGVRGNSVTSIGQEAFHSAGQNQDSAIPEEIYIYNTVNMVGLNAFAYYFKDSGVIGHFESETLINGAVTPEDMGLSGYDTIID